MDYSNNIASYATVLRLINSRSGTINAMLRDSPERIQQIYASQMVEFQKDRSARYNVTELNGAIFVTDTMERSQPDRVFPILPEEQGVFCYLIQDKISKLSAKAKIVEAGSGSGVLSILASRYAEHPVKIDAYEISPRAIFFSIINAALSRVTNIAFHNKDFSKEKFSESVDAVIMNPPYNPTWPGLDSKKVALHAQAGQWGQDLYKDWLGKSHSILSDKGILLVHMMFPCNGKIIPALNEADRTFANAKIDWIDHIGICNTRQFLQAQYSKILRKPRSNSCGDWCKQMAAEYPNLILLSYALESNSNEPGSQENLEAVTSSVATWRDRTKLHAQIVNSSIERGVMKS